GNIRELKNALERALLLSPRGELSADEFLPAGDAGSTQDGPIPFPAPLHQITAAAVRATVRMSGGNRSEAARRLSISPRRLRRLLSGALDLGEDPDEGWWVESTARSMYMGATVQVAKLDASLALHEPVTQKLPLDRGGPAARLAHRMHGARRM